MFVLIFISNIPFYQDQISGLMTDHFGFGLPCYRLLEERPTLGFLGLRPLLTMYKSITQLHTYVLSKVWL